MTKNLEKCCPASQLHHTWCCTQDDSLQHWLIWGLMVWDIIFSTGHTPCSKLLPEPVREPQWSLQSELNSFWSTSTPELRRWWSAAARCLPQSSFGCTLRGNIYKLPFDYKEICTSNQIRHHVRLPRERRAWVPRFRLRNQRLNQPSKHQFSEGPAETSNEDLDGALSRNSGHHKVDSHQIGHVDSGLHGIMLYCPLQC